MIALWKKQRSPFLTLTVACWLLLSGWLPTSAQRVGASTPAVHRGHSKHTGRARPQQAVSVKVWVNTRSGVYHYPGQRWYGRTRDGQYMSEAQARSAGYRATMNGQ